ncbi:hypothetical protein Vretifemale_369 [Volvox reticuliferus]|uniref:Uncharacterized protein n=2 Tax=Volvox reticuliferus TaxID=1737510 RepID=A0A8J4C162_9CHLO|nr:hypothetical protein Vretifemale_369 [Volvox reticuliferus]
MLATCHPECGICRIRCRSWNVSIEDLTSQSFLPALGPVSPRCAHFRPVEQLGRWMGIRRLEPAASRLDRVRGSWAAYEPVTSRLVVLDQKEQKIAFVDLDLDLAGQSGGDCGRGCGHGGVDCPRGSALTEVSDAVDVDDAIKCCTAGAGAELDRPWGSSSNCGGNGNTDSRSIHIDDDVPCVRRQLHELQKPEAQPMRIVTPGPLMPAVLHMPVPDPDPEPHQAGVAAALIQAPGAMLGEQQLLQQAAGVGPAPPDAPQQQVEQQQPNNGPEMLSQEERHKLQVVATCGNGMVATGHPDGRVLIWDASRAAVAYTLPRVEGCGRGPVLAVAADDMFLAAAYSGEVMVWEIRRCRGKFVRDGDGKERVAAHHFTSSPPSLLALIKPTLATAVRSMALSSRHCVLAMRSWDGVELREIRGGRWLNSISDRRNTALLAAGDVLFVASSSPSFLGNSFLQFEIEVMAIDLPAVMAAAAAADVGRDGASDASAAGAAAARAGAPGAAGGGGGGGGGGGDGGAAAEAPQGPLDGGAGRRNVAASQPGTAITPLVVRTVTPPQRYTMRGPPMAQFGWDQPMQLCLTGGMLLLRCLQFPVATGQLAWPGMFAFRLGDLLYGLTLGRCNGAGPIAAQERARAASASSAGAPPPPRPSGPGPDVRAQAPAASADLQQLRQAEAAEVAPPAVVICRTVPPEVLCGDGGFATEWSLGPGISGSPGGVMRRSIASVQMLAAKRHLVILSASQEAWVMKVPYCRAGKSTRTQHTAMRMHR